MAVPLAHAVRLDREQRKTARQADREADRFGASPMERLGLFEALAVEAVYRNPEGGDQDSVGSLQERDHYGSVARRLNVKLASRRFLQEARALRESGQRFANAGALAAAVQRPREDLRGRYQEERSTALAVVNRYGGLRGGAAASSSGPGGPVQGSVPLNTTGAFDPGSPAANVSLAAAPPAPIASAGVPEPEFAARPVLPEGYRVAPSIGGPQPAPGPEVAQGAQGLSEDFSPEAPPEAGSGGSRGSGGPARVRGAGRYPLGRRGEVIGVPYQGTHTLGNWQSDNAVDIGVKEGTRVLSIGDGVVEKVSGGYSGGKDRFDGFQITYRTKGGQRVFVTHLKAAGVKAGDRIRRGSVLGRSGSANGVPHLHMGVEHGDPRKYV